MTITLTNSSHASSDITAENERTEVVISKSKCFCFTLYTASACRSDGADQEVVGYRPVAGSDEARGNSKGGRISLSKLV